MRLNLEGSMIGGYQVSEHIADGSHTEVYLATAPDGAAVIIKALNINLRTDIRLTDEQALWYFENEVNAYTRIRHDHIVALMEHGIHRWNEEMAFRYLILEYMPGGSLGAYCKEKRILPLDEVIRLFSPVCDALSLLHRNGVIHCDIKPTNLLLDDPVQPTIIKLADLGVAKILVDGQGQDRALVGTPPYAAPEHSPNADPGDLMQPVDIRSDVFALAMTIFYAMTGIKPKFDGQELEELPFHPSFQQYRQRLSTVLRRASAARVENRYTSVEEFWSDFKDYKSLRPPLSANDDEVPTVYAQYGKMVVTFGPQTSQEAADHTSIIPLPEGVYINLVRIPAGQFLMGNSREEIERLVSSCPSYLRDYASTWLKREHPPHPVNIEAFWIGEHSVTIKEWRVVATNLPQAVRYLNPAPCDGFSGEQPVTMVSWEEAVEFCLRLTLYLQRDCRLPSESEWEYACRAGTATAFNFVGPLDGQVNYIGVWPNESERTDRLTARRSANVASLGGSNPFGLRDMHGNVWEWCADAWHDSYIGAPSDGKTWDDLHDALRVIRGGSHRAFGISCRSASRASFLCIEKTSDIGFRIALNER